MALRAEAERGSSVGQREHYQKPSPMRKRGKALPYRSVMIGRMKNDGGIWLELGAAWAS